MMILDLPTQLLQLLTNRHLYNFYNDLVQWYLYNDCMQYCPLEDFMWLTSCCCHVPWLLLFSCYPLLHLALLCFPRKSGPLQPLTTHDLAFFLPSRSLILNLVYLSYFRSSIYDFWLCRSTLSLLSHAIGLIQFGFFKGDLCPISHNDLIMDCFSRANFYGVPCVTIS